MGLLRAVRRKEEGTSAVFCNQAFFEKWWADSMECYYYLRNIQHLLSDGKTPNERLFGEPFKGPLVPFGAMVGITPCFCQRPVATASLYEGGIWKGDIMVADKEELEEMDASEIHGTRLNAKEVLTPMR